MHEATNLSRGFMPDCEQCAGTGCMTIADFELTVADFPPENAWLAFAAMPLPCPTGVGFGRSLTEAEMIEIEERYLHWSGF